MFTVEYKAVTLDQAGDFSPVARPAVPDARTGLGRSAGTIRVVTRQRGWLKLTINIRRR
jgi:hypothetical protein